MVKIGSKRIPISFSSEDFRLLYRVQEGYLYTGKGRDKMWQLADIIKAMIMDTWIDLFLRDHEVSTSFRLLPFTVNYKGSKYAKTQKEYDSIITSYFATLKRDNGALRALEKKDKIAKTSLSLNGGFWENHIIEHLIGSENTIHDDRAKTNFILTLKEDELEVLDDVKYAIQAFINTTISYSEMVRVIFKNLLYTDTFSSHTFKNYFLSSIYLGALYDFSPQDSILIFSQLTSIDHIFIDANMWYVMRSVDRDREIFNDYCKEIRKPLKSQHEKNQTKNETEYTYIFDFSDILNNLKMERKFRSSISDFNFHSAFIGFTLYLLEWTYSQHNPSLIATYLTGSFEFSNSKGVMKEFIGEQFTSYAFSDVFVPQMNTLYEMSRKTTLW